MGKINTDNYPNRPFSSYQDDDMFILQDNGGETYTTNVGDIKNLADSRIKLEGVQVNGADLPISGKKVNVDISGKTDLKVIAFPFHDPEPGEPSMGFFKGAYVTYNGKLYEFTQEHQGAWNPSHVREIDVDKMYVRAGNGGYNNGDYATTEGHSTRAEGEAAHAEGTGTIANSDNQHAGGRYNVADPDDEYTLIIGNGTADNARSNAMTLDWDGNLEVSGEVENGNGEKISDKTDKVTNATSGHLAGLDANGNLTDSGVSPTEDVTVEGNPVTFDSPFEQDAKNVVVSVKPIQDLHGYDHPWPARGGKNKLQVLAGTDSAQGVTVVRHDDGSVDVDGTPEVANYGFTLVNSFNLKAGSYKLNGSNNGGVLLMLYDTNDQYIADSTDGADGSFTLADNTDVRLRVFVYSDHGLYDDTLYPMIRSATETDPTFAPYSNICPISGTNEVEIEVSDGESEPTTTTIPLPSTLYDADVDVTNGDADETYGIVDLGDLNWIKITTNVYAAEHRGIKVVSDSETADLKCEIFYPSNYVYLPEGSIATRRGEEIWVRTFTDDLTEFENLVNGYKLVYPLAIPTTISFDPTDVELLEGTNVVTTNAEKVAVTYGRSLWQDISDLKTDTEGKLNKSDVATIEGDTASRPYSVNEFMLRSDGFYKVTQPIAQNASITSSNTTKTTIGAVLTALLNS